MEKLRRLCFCGAVLVLVLSVWAVWSDVVWGQSPPIDLDETDKGITGSNDRDEACRKNRNSEECICWSVYPNRTEWVLVETVRHPVSKHVLFERGVPLSYLALHGFMEPWEWATLSDREIVEAHMVEAYNDEDVVKFRAKAIWFQGFYVFENGEPIRKDIDDVEVERALVRNLQYRRDCAFAFLEEDLRRIWIISGSIAAMLVTLTVAWAGVVHMQETASGQGLARTRAILLRAIMGAILVGSCYLIVEAINIELLGVMDHWWSSGGVGFVNPR